MADFKNRITVNGVEVSLLGHLHSYLSNSGMPGVTDAYIENVNDTYGTVRMHMQNRTGVNGVLYEQLGSVDLIDFVFKTLSTQSNIRLESRAAYWNNAANSTGEWQFGPPILGEQWLSLGASQSRVLAPFLGMSTITATSTVSGSNLDVNGFSTNITATKVRTIATQAITATTNTKIIFGSVEHTTNAASWVAATNRYVALTPGIYAVKGNIRCTGTNRSSKLMLYKNGVLWCALQDNNTTAAVSPSYGGATDIQLAANDYLELWFYASGATTIANSPDCNFSVYRVG